MVATNHFNESLLPQIDIDQAQAGGITDQFHGIMDVEFTHDIGTMVFNGFDTDTKLIGNFEKGGYRRLDVEDRGQPLSRVCAPLTISRTISAADWRCSQQSTDSPAY